MNASIKGTIAYMSEGGMPEFTHKGLTLSQDDLFAILRYAVNKGYKTTDEITDDEIDAILINGKPKPTLKSFQPLVDLCQQHIDNIATGKEDESIRHYIYETAIECVFGKDVWNWINSHC